MVVNHLIKILRQDYNFDFNEHSHMAQITFQNVTDTARIVKHALFPPHVAESFMYNKYFHSEINKIERNISLVYSSFRKTLSESKIRS